jgi:hypothetical protein
MGRMIIWLVLVVVAVWVVAGCGAARATAPGQFVASPSDVYRLGPDEFGVVCYRFSGTHGTSCVKVKEGTP